MRLIRFALALPLALVPSAALAQQKATIAVIPFTFHKDFRASPGAALETGALTQKFVTALVGTRKFDVVERERLEKILDEMQLGKTGLMDPTRAVEAGKALGADYMLMGEVSVFTLTTSLKHIELADRWQRTEELRLIVDMRIVETRTTKIVSAFKGDAAMTTKQMFKAKPSLDAPIEPATVDEIERQVVDKLVIKVIDAVYPIRVIGVTGDVVSINRGEGGGVPMGTELDVFTEGEEMVDPDTGEVLGSEETKVGRIKVQEVLPKFSKCSILAGRPQKGNICRLAKGAAEFAPPPPPPPPRDTTPPVIRILAPKEGGTLNGNPINVVCEVTDDSGVVSKVQIAGRDAERDDKGRYRGPVQARDGGNRIRVEAWDGAGNRGEAAVTFNFDSTPPQVEGEATILVEGKVDDLTCTLTVNGQRVEYDKQTGRYSVRVSRDPQQPDTVTIVAEDEFGNKTTQLKKLQ